MTFVKKLKSRWAGLILWLLLAVGVSMIVYPWMEARHQENEQLRLLAEWSAELQAAAAVSPQSPPAAAEPVKLALTADNRAQEPEPAPVPQWKKVDDLELLGSLRIGNIDLTEPIVKGVDETALKHGAGTVLEGVLPGQIGNFVLAGHRGWAGGRYFNRLNELEPGDDVDIETTAGTYRYIVTEKLVVEPDDLSVLQSEPGESMLTLITCHPLRTHTHRLIVKAKLVSLDKEPNQ